MQLFGRMNHVSHILHRPDESDSVEKDERYQKSGSDMRSEEYFQIYVG